MSDPSNLPHTTTGALSAQIEQRYRCRLSADLADWFDAKIWQVVGHNEYHLPVDPAVLLHETPEVIWPGLMPCDLLPLIGNDAGDWLCVRFTSDGSASEIVQWYHGGGDWIPWGRSIAEAIVFDALRDRLPGPKREHAEPAERPVRKAADLASDAVLCWARGHLPADVSALFKKKQATQDVVATLLQNETSEIAVRCILVEAALDEPLSNVLTPQVAEALGINWSTAVMWMFDLHRVPDESKNQLQQECGVSFGEIQDWEQAANHCRRVIELSPDLAWAWDILGYAQERGGAQHEAIEAYRHGAMTSVFSDQSVRLRTHWAAKQSAKFSVARLLSIVPESVRDSTYLRMLCEGAQEQSRRSVTEYWLAEADEATVIGNVGRAHEDLVRAGWDLGAEPMSAYAEILQRIAETAVQADRAAQAELAETHRACLQDRYGI